MHLPIATYPFETLVKEIQSGRDASRSPLIQVLFNFQNTPAEDIGLHGLSWMPFEIDLSSSQFDISITFDTEITRKILVAYNTDLYEAGTIARMLRHYQRLLEAVVANPDVSIGRISILSDDERRQVLEEWNDTDIELPQSCVHELFEVQARKTPDAVAVSFEDRQVSYKTLDRRANQIAHGLRGMGVKPETLVGICLERSIDLLAGLLGILKAGGAYVPSDPAYPLERIRFMIEDSGMGVLLTQKKLVKHLPKIGCSTLLLDAVSEIPTAEPGETFPVATPSNLAYVIYTSGSTGNPKALRSNTDHWSIFFSQ